MFHGLSTECGMCKLAVGIVYDTVRDPALEANINLYSQHLCELSGDTQVSSVLCVFSVLMVWTACACTWLVYDHKPIDLTNLASDILYSETCKLMIG